MSNSNNSSRNCYKPPCSSTRLPKNSSRRAASCTRTYRSTNTAGYFMDKTYDPHAIEQRWYQIWEQNGYFAPQGAGPPYCIMIPPPNVTGSLHLGHAFQVSIMVSLIRYLRMNGKKALWQAGTDHAGIATQMVVEREHAEQR